MKALLDVQTDTLESTKRQVDKKQTRTVEERDQEIEEEEKGALPEFNEVGLLLVGDILDQNTVVLAAWTRACNGNEPLTWAGERVLGGVRIAKKCTGGSLVNDMFLVFLVCYDVAFVPRRLVGPFPYR